MSQIKLTADSGGGTTSLKAPSSTTSNGDVVLKLPVADGSANQVLKTDGSGQLSFTSNAGTTINNNADNRVITGSGTANTLEGESGLTFASKILDLNQGNNSANTINGTLQFSNVNHSVAKIEGYTRTTEDDGDIRFYTKNGGTFTEGLRLSFHAEPKLQMLAGETEIVSDATEAALTLRADPGQNRSSSSIKFDVDATVRGRFTSDGLCFGSDTAAANALGDYEEGTWTPTSNVGSITVYSAHYVKIGKAITVQAYIEFPSMSGSSGVNIAGFPFSAGGGDDRYSCAVVSNTNFGGYQMLGQLSNVTLDLKSPSGSSSDFSVNALSGKYIVFSIAYTMV